MFVTSLSMLSDVADSDWMLTSDGAVVAVFLVISDGVAVVVDSAGVEVEVVDGGVVVKGTGVVVAVVDGVVAEGAGVVTVLADDGLVSGVT